MAGTDSKSKKKEIARTRAWLYVSKSQITWNLKLRSPIQLPVECASFSFQFSRFTGYNIDQSGTQRKLEREGERKRERESERERKRLFNDHGISLVELEISGDLEISQSFALLDGNVALGVCGKRK